MQETFGCEQQVSLRIQKKCLRICLVFDEMWRRHCLLPRALVHCHAFSVISDVSLCNFWTLKMVFFQFKVYQEYCVVFVNLQHISDNR